MNKTALAIGIGLALALFALRAPAIEVDAAECREASQFIGNAAQSRKNGATKEMFVGKLDEDLFVLSSMPPEVRWFAHGDEEAQFLRAAVLEVFDFPREPAVHAAEFFTSCLQTAGLNSPDEPTPVYEAPGEGRGGWRGRA
jgi:hypothetical protein